MLTANNASITNPDDEVFEPFICKEQIEFSDQLVARVGIAPIKDGDLLYCFDNFSWYKVYPCPENPTTEIDIRPLFTISERIIPAGSRFIFQKIKNELLNKSIN